MDPNPSNIPIQQTPNLSSTPQQTPLAPPKSQRLFTIIGILLFVLLIVLFTPVPYYQSGELICKMGQPCPKIGWHANPPLIKNLIAALNKSDQVRSIRNDSFPTITPIPNPTANWKLYTNSTHNFSFKYPPTWIINTKGESENINATIQLVKGSSLIQIYANMNGIGGNGVDYEGTPTKVGGLNLYKYESENTYANTKQIGITDDLTQSFGLFNYGGKRYSIFLTYPTKTLSESEIVDLINEFDRILSTFKFIENTNASCKYKGKTYTNGESVPDKCNSCSCENGQVACTLRACL